MCRFRLTPASDGWSVVIVVSFLFDGKFGTALIGTLEEGLGDKFTPELRGAWTEGFLLISSLMRRGAAKISGAFPVVTPDSTIGPMRAAGFDAA